MEQQGGDIAVIPRSIGGGSNPIAALNVEPDTPPESSFNNNSDPNHDQRERERERERKRLSIWFVIDVSMGFFFQKLGWRNFVIYRPWFPCFISLLLKLASMLPLFLQEQPEQVKFQQIELLFHFVDFELMFCSLVENKTSLETNLQAGASHGYELLWVVLIGFFFAIIIQSLAANLGVSTGKHLSEFCKAEYPRMVKNYLWILAEIAVIAADIPEVIGTAFGLNILFNISVWAGFLLTGLSTLLLLGLQRYGVRKFEMLIAMLVFVMAGCFFREMSYVKPPASGVVKGMFVPKLNGQGATGDAIALLGAIFMPHNIFLHSALVLSIKVPNSVRGVNDACRYFLIESGIALFVAFLINVAIVSVFATNVLEKSSKALYAVALLASGQSSSITGTYTGQFIMHGFLNLHMKKWVRNIMNRCIAITPSLIMILSFELPFALISLLKFSSSSTKIMIDNYIFIALQVIAISWILGIGIIGINVYYLRTSFVDWLVHNDVPKLGNVLIGIVVLPLTAIYIIAVIYLTCR
ncbi:hypothetical protein ES288_D06G233400v1 [Gossypium darwinii]|uniref:Metal transporter n=1 Tax=Gossypium darwinii TaxID=34276 RepID=A0A5D2CCV4_GOSDA|nr:hypothetical protein ES288_D06G233400v1 [Gossypium darwinii]